jgi:hypothetical protein
VTRVRNRYPRIPCVVPFCGCGATCYPPGHEIICPKHYRLVDASLKAKRRKVRHLLRKARATDTDRARRLDNWLWSKIVKQAITRAAGAPL